ITIEVGSTSTETVHANDSLGGVGVNSSTVSTSILNDGGSGVAITSEGTLTVASSTSTGTYTITYQICEIGAVPENCATATVTLIVTKIQTPTNVINAENDTITIEVGSTSTETVHANDSLGGVGVNSSTVSTSILNDAGSGVAITSEGTLTVASSTSTGTYTITYQICEIGAVPENCATATVVLIVTKVQTPISYIIANDDEDEVLTGMTVGVRVLKNDENVPTTGILSVVVSPTNGKVSLFNNGAFNNPSDDVIIYVPNKGFVGIDTFEYKICDGLGSCATALVTIRVLNDVIPYNGMSMNADGLNDFFYIRGIEDFPTNKVAIYNYSGIKVFEIKGYNNKEKVFKGHSNIGLTIAPSSKLPQGTYYYIIEYSDKNNRKYTKASWMYIKY
uniref:T9SS type B sorting domain-containing protein n=1 Tax=Capnocytophaga canis TaxID=1848903 RepID=UPI001562B7BD